MTKKVKLFNGFRCIGLLGVILMGLIAILGTGGGDNSSDKYLVNGKVIHDPPPPATNSSSAPTIFDLSVISTGGSLITFSVSFNDSEADVTTFCIAFDDQPHKYYAYDVKEDAYGKTGDQLSVTDTINISIPETYCFTVFVQDEAGNTSNILSSCFLLECGDCYDCTANCDNGTLTIKGTLDGDPIDLSGNACANNKGDIGVGILYCNGVYVGLKIKEPGKLVSGTTYTVKPYGEDENAPDAFPIVVEQFLPKHWHQSASSGTFTVTTFNENTLVASFELVMSDGGTVSGDINIWSFKDSD